MVHAIYPLTGCGDGFTGGYAGGFLDPQPPTGGRKGWPND